MTVPTSLEQFYLELVNSARLDPISNAARYIASYSPLTSGDPDVQSALSFFGVNGAALQAAIAALTPVQPLAWNDALGTAARTHSELMITNDQQSHQLPGEASLGTRITAAGYTGWSAIAENIYAYSESAIHGHAGFMVDWGSGPNGMQSPAGHRIAIMNASYREIGIGVVEENNGSTSVGPQVVTEDFGARFSGTAVLVLGVTYGDTDSNGFYSVGEGVGGMTVAVGAANTVSAAGGGYTLGLAAGTHAITFSGGLLASSATFTASLSTGTNAKVDIVGGTTLRTSVSGTLAGSIARIEALGTVGLSLTGDDGNQTIVGTGGADNLTGAGGTDVLEGRAGTDVLSGGADSDVLIGGAGADGLTGGTGNDTFRFVSAGDSTRTAMDAIADFQSGDVLQFSGIAGINFRTSPYLFQASTMQTVDAIVADMSIANAYVHFTDGADGYLFIKGIGTAISFDQVLIELSGRTVPLGVADILGAGVIDPGAPEVVVRGNTVGIADGDTTPASTDHTDFGTVGQGGSALSRVFTVGNSGTAALTTAGLAVPTGFSIVEGLSASIAAGASDTFTVRLDTATVGTKSGQITFTTNDGDENPFNFTIAGIVRANTLPVIAGQTQLTVLANQWLRADGLAITFTDADGDPIVGGEVKDMSAAAGSAYLWFNGAAAAQGATVTFANEAEFDTLWLRGGTAAGTNAFDVRVTDGYGYTGWRTLTVKTATALNQAPVAVVNDQSVVQGAVIAFVVNPGAVADPKAQIVLTLSDGNADAIQTYRFWDPAGGGQIRIGGVAITPNTAVDVAAGNLGQVTYAGAATAGSELLWIQAYDGETWSAWESWSERTLRATNTLPVIAGQTQLTVLANQWLRADGLAITFTDADGDPIVGGEVKDMSAAAGSAYLWFNGAAAAQGATVTFANEAEFDTLWLRGGTAAGTNAFDVRVTDGYGYTGWRTLTVKTATALNQAPVAVVNDQSVVQGAVIAFVVNPGAVADPKAQIVLTLSDGNADAIQTYRFWDPAGGGQIRIGGVAITPNTAVDVAAGNLGQVTYAGAATAGSELLWIQAYDGETWSAWESWSERTLRATNVAPVVNTVRGLLRVDEWIDASNAAFVQFSDADADPWTLVELRDLTPAAASGYLWFNGSSIPANQIVQYSPADLAAGRLPWMRGGSSEMSDTYELRVYDGMDWSAWQTMTVVTRAANQRPVITASNGSVTVGQATAAASLFSATDANSDGLSRFRLWDGGTAATSGYFNVGGVRQAAGTNIDLSFMQLAGTQFVGGAQGGSDLVWAQAFDGREWSDWKSWTMTTLG